MTPLITATYAAILAILFVIMSFYVIVTRARTNILVGHEDNMTMLVAMRRHGNMVEYVPFAILMMGLAEMTGLGATWLHVCGLALIAGRLIHPIGVNETKSALAARVAGVLATMVAILVPAGSILLTNLT